MNILRRFALFVLLGVAGTSALRAQQTFNTTIYFDYTFNLANNGYMTGTDAAKALDNKFNFRRAYFTYENKISDSLRFRFRYDADNTGNLTSLSGSKDDKLRPFIKHLYLQWNPNFLYSTINIGMIETLSFKMAEDRWGYRSVAKTFLDIYKDITGVDIRQSSADIGASWKGTLAKELRFGVGVFNGEGYSHPESNKYKKVAGYLQFVPTAGLSLNGYLDYEPQVPTAALSAPKAVTYKIEAFFEMVPGLTLVGEWFTYNNDKYLNADASHYNVGGYSVFGSYKVVRDKFSLFARFDHYEPNSTMSSKNTDLVILGADWNAWGSNCRLQPNVWLYNYADSNKKSDAVFALTFFMSF
jgi:hypothetical protein